MLIWIALVASISLATQPHEDSVACRALVASRYKALFSTPFVTRSDVLQDVIASCRNRIATAGSTNISDIDADLRMRMRDAVVLCEPIALDVVNSSFGVPALSFWRKTPVFRKIVRTCVLYPRIQSERHRDFVTENLGALVNSRWNDPPPTSLYNTTRACKSAFELILRLADKKLDKTDGTLFGPWRARFCTADVLARCDAVVDAAVAAMSAQPFALLRRGPRREILDSLCVLAAPRSRLFNVSGHCLSACRAALTSSCFLDCHVAPLRVNLSAIARTFCAAHGGEFCAPDAPFCSTVAAQAFASLRPSPHLQRVDFDFLPRHELLCRSLLRERERGAAEGILSLASIRADVRAAMRAAACEFSAAGDADALSRCLLFEGTHADFVAEEAQRLLTRAARLVSSLGALAARGAERSNGSCAAIVDAFAGNLTARPHILVTLCEAVTAVPDAIDALFENARLHFAVQSDAFLRNILSLPPLSEAAARVDAALRACNPPPACALEAAPGAVAAVRQACDEGRGHVAGAYVACREGGGQGEVDGGVEGFDFETCVEEKKGEGVVWGKICQRQ
jgi:putative hemolysin